MQRARDLAEHALRIAENLTTQEIDHFEWQFSWDTGVYHVTLFLTDGTNRRYLVIEEKEGRAASG